LKTLILISEVHPPNFEWLLLEEVAPEVEEEVVKDKIHPLKYFPK